MLNISNSIDMESKDYKSVFFFGYSDFSPPPKKYRGRKNPRYCRFCRQFEGSITFKNEAHVIPQGFGNRYLISLEQCDQCNQKCGLAEFELMKMFDPIRGLAVSRKADQSYIKFKTKLGSFIKSGISEDTRTISIVKGDPDLVDLSENDGFLKLKATVHDINTFAAAKALGMMAWHVIPETKLDYLEHFRQWFTTESVFEFKASMFLQQILRVKDTPTSLTLFQRHSMNKDAAPFVVGFTYEAFALTMPIPDATFRVEQPKIPITNKLGKDNIQAGEAVNIQAISSDRDGKVSFSLVIVLGPGNKVEEIYN